MITNDGDRNDDDERVFVTRMFGELIDPARPDGFDDAKQGVIDTFTVGAAVAGNAQVAQLHLAPLASGFNADRRQFCTRTREALEVGVRAEKVIFFNSGANGVPDDIDDSNLANDDVLPGCELGRRRRGRPDRQGRAEGVSRTCCSPRWCAAASCTCRTSARRPSRR